MQNALRLLILLNEAEFLSRASMVSQGFFPAPYFPLLGKVEHCAEPMNEYAVDGTNTHKKHAIARAESLAPG